MEVQDDEWAETVQHNTPHTPYTQAPPTAPPLHTHVPFSLPLYTISPSLLRHTPHTVPSSHLQGQTHNETIAVSIITHLGGHGASPPIQTGRLVGLGQQQHKCLQVIG